MLNLSFKSDCCGCTACESVCSHTAITMKKDTEGFMYPNIDTDLCVDCGLCEKVCPIKFRDDQQYELHKQTLYACHVKDEVVWVKSSSGGAFTALTDYVLHHDGIIFGAYYNDEFVVVHGGAENETDCLKFRGSKYSQSDVSGIYTRIKQLLRQNRLVLFSGTPCQVEGLKCFLRKPYTNLITVDLLCHSVPSPKVFSDYVSLLRRKYKRTITSINMKDKTNGWTNQSLRLSFDDDTSVFGEENTMLWNKLFYSNTIIRPSCHACRFSNTNRPGDITIGDYWGIENVHPEFFDNRGISILITNTEIGENAFKEIKDSLICIESEIEKALSPQYVYSTPQSPIREQFWDYYLKHGFERACERYFDYGSWNAFKRNLRDKIHAVKMKIIK